MGWMEPGPGTGDRGRGTGVLLLKNPPPHYSTPHRQQQRQKPCAALRGSGLVARALLRADLFAIHADDLRDLRIRPTPTAAYAPSPSPSKSSPPPSSSSQTATISWTQCSLEGVMPPPLGIQRLIKETALNRVLYSPRCAGRCQM